MFSKIKMYSWANQEGCMKGEKGYEVNIYKKKCCFTNDDVMMMKDVY